MYLPDIIYENLPKVYNLIGIAAILFMNNFGQWFGFLLVLVAVYIYLKRKYYRSMVAKFEAYDGY